MIELILFYTLYVLLINYYIITKCKLLLVANRELYQSTRKISKTVI